MILLGKIGVGLLGTVMVAGAAVSSEGFIHVKVHEKRADGTHLTLIIPAAIVPATLGFVPREHLRDAADNIREYLPVIDAAIPALEDTPDGILVEVRDPNDHVVVTKSGGSIVVDVNDREDVVHVSVPLRAAHSAIRQIAGANAEM
jgi:hypothetical protein